MATVQLEGEINNNILVLMLMCRSYCSKCLLKDVVLQVRRFDRDVRMVL